jgi:hypothetical protein
MRGVLMVFAGLAALASAGAALAGYGLAALIAAALMIVIGIAQWLSLEKPKP